MRNATNFFEFGTGASTVPLASSEVFVLFCWARYLAMRFPNLHIHSVELDGSWVSNLASAWPLLGSLCRVSLSRPAHYANSRHDCKSFSCVLHLRLGSPRIHTSTALPIAHDSIIPLFSLPFHRHIAPPCLPTSCHATVVCKTSAPTVWGASPLIHVRSSDAVDTRKPY